MLHAVHTQIGKKNTRIFLPWGRTSVCPFMHFIEAMKSVSIIKGRSLRRWLNRRACQPSLYMYTFTLTHWSPPSLIRARRMDSTRSFASSDDFIFTLCFYLRMDAIFSFSVDICTTFIYAHTPRGVSTRSPVSTRLFYYNFRSFLGQPPPPSPLFWCWPQFSFRPADISPHTVIVCVGLCARASAKSLWEKGQSFNIVAACMRLFLLAGHNALCSL